MTTRYPVDPNGAYSSAPDDLLEKARRELEEALDAAELGRCTGYAAPEPEPKDEWEEFLRDVTRNGLGPRVTPRRGWVLAGGPALRPGHDRRAVAVALEVRAPGSTMPHLLTVPLVRTPLILDYLSGRGFLCPAERLLDPIGHPFERAPWANVLTPTVFTLPHMLEVRFEGREDELQELTISGAVELAHSLADAARIAHGEVRVR